MRGKIFILLGIFAVFASGFLSARYDLGPVFSKTLSDVFGSAVRTEPVLEIPLGGENTQISADAPQSDTVSGDKTGSGGKTGIGNLPRNPALVLKPTIIPDSTSGQNETKIPPASETLPPAADILPAKININTASREELQKITGVGHIIAQHIIDYRNQNGPFRTIEDIKNVSGIGEAKFQKMKDEITVGEVAPPAASLFGPPATSSVGVSQYYEVGVSMQGDGSGKVMSSPAGINCGFDCVEEFSAGTQVIFTAVPEANSFFDGWSGACSGKEDCVLSVSGRLAVVATFKLNGSSQPVPSSSTGSGQAPSAETTAGKILISEIFYDAIGGDAGKEFIELYNSGTGDVDLSGWSLKRDGTSLASIGSKPEDKKIIKAGGFFLIGLNSYAGTPTADLVRSASLPNTSATIALYDASGNLADSVAYNNSVSAGQSYERAPLAESGQFVVQPNPNPQNSGQ